MSRGAGQGYWESARGAEGARAFLSTSFDWAGYVREVVVAFNSWQAQAVADLFAPSLVCFGITAETDRPARSAECDQRQIQALNQAAPASSALDARPWNLLPDGQAYYCEAEEWQLQDFSESLVLLSLRLRLYSRTGTLLRRSTACWVVQLWPDQQQAKVVATFDVPPEER